MCRWVPKALDLVGLNVIDRGTEGLLPVLEVSVPVVELPFARIGLVGRRMRVGAFGVFSGLRWEVADSEATLEVPASGLSRIDSTCLGFRAHPGLFEIETPKLLLVIITILHFLSPEASSFLGTIKSGEL